MTRVSLINNGGLSYMCFAGKIRDVMIRQILLLDHSVVVGKLQETTHLPDTIHNTMVHPAVKKMVVYVVNHRGGVFGGLSADGGGLSKPGLVCGPHQCWLRIYAKRSETLY
jgi:hypothetical protein